jgi:4-hydroxyproline epimerase
MHRISIIDTHTGGEPTRVVVAGGPDLGTGSLVERRARFREEFDGYRSAIVNEPRGSDVMVGALLVEPSDPACVAGIIFFNNVGYLNMCGHGTIGVVVALGHLGRIAAGTYQLETPVGIVGFDYDGRNRVTIENVPSYRYVHHVTVEVPGYGPVSGDVAWGGNWFFLVHDHGQELHVRRAAELTDFTTRLRRALVDAGITGHDGGEIDHIELFGPPADPANHGRNFVLCPGLAYDRSPCGTGTSANVACLAAAGTLAEGDVWRQESLVGSVFEGSYRVATITEDREARLSEKPGFGPVIIPRITGTAYVNGEATLLLDPHDPFQWGIRG